MRQGNRARQRNSAALTVARVVGVTALVAGSALAMTQAGAATDDGKPAAAAQAKKAQAKKAGAAAEKADFNGDGYADTVAAAPGATVAGKKGVGVFTITYGSAKGADTANRQVIASDSLGMPGTDNFGGRSLARDFDGDGITDLAVNSGGTLHVLWGEKGKGLTSSSAFQDSKGGGSITSGDFDGDGTPDIAGSTSGGDVETMYGPFTRDGKSARTASVTPGHTFNPEDLVAGDITGDGIDDLVSTHAFEEMSESSEFFTGSKTGLVNKPKEVDDAATAVIADVDKDGYEDLVIRTVPGGVLEDLPYDHGTVKVLYGSPEGPGAKRATTLTQNSAGVPGVNEDGDEFGKSLSAGDVNGDGYADIAVGVPGEDIGSGAAGKDAGAVVQLLGGKGGLSGTGAKNYDQGTAGVPGAVEGGDGFGSALSLHDTDGDGRDDLAVGAPGEDGAGASAVDAGAVWVLRGSTSGLTTDGVVSYGPATLGLPEKRAELGDSFAH
ncbi:FG-GAP-like repeat-containing protein [Streptomyces iconiensis]|uniref:FG-GAP-like repeat-containing protein n=1 Tax=Streptomyces iconiensis TaxID=1384038 RepID=A0ABT7A4X0_9ACTN|nr:FG-GAP-like repeat-containing protein [Streptomyces iconiensis]MDJ1136074.1 FG-GAP-like repeat-containing protein [Streptomyces iconiensis]